MLDDGGVGHGERADPEAEGDAADWFERDTPFAQERVDDAVDKWDEDDDGDGVEVLHQIVWDAVAGHLARLRDEVVAELAVADPVDWVDGEDFAADQRSLELVDEEIVPVDRL